MAPGSLIALAPLVGPKPVCEPMSMIGAEPIFRNAWVAPVLVVPLPTIRLKKLMSAASVLEPPRSRRSSTGWLTIAGYGLDALQVPAWQVSPCVQLLPSLHTVPLATTGFEHRPVAGAHV